MISVSNVHMKYPVPKRIRELVIRPFKKPEKITALSDINLEITEGERIAFLGPNGAGKTSLLKLIAGLLLPSQGIITVNGFDTVKNNNEARKSVGLVMNEERSFYWRLTGTQNLEFFGALENLSGNNLNNKIHESIELVGMQDAAAKQVGTYSSGMKQKLAIARGLLTDPDIIILDEPTRTLDPISAEEQAGLLLNKLHSDMKKTLLIATHRLDEAERLCSKICIINKGRIIAFRNLSDLKRKKISLNDFYRRCIGQVK